MGQCNLNSNLTNNNMKVFNEIDTSNLNTIQERSNVITDEEIKNLRTWIEMRKAEEDKEIDTLYKGKFYSILTSKRAKNLYKSVFWDFIIALTVANFDPLRILRWLGPLLDYTKQIVIAGVTIPITVFNGLHATQINEWIHIAVSVFGEFLSWIPIIGKILKNLQIGFIEETLNARYLKNIYEWVHKNLKKSPEEMDVVTLESNAKAHIQAFKKKK